MITLHDVHKQGSEAVKAAVLAFGARHPLNNTGRGAAPTGTRQSSTSPV